MDRFDLIEAKAQDLLRSGAFSSIEWRVLRDGAVFSEGRLGQADAVLGTALPDVPIYRIFSMTKPIISVIALMMIEQGKLRLSDPLSAHLPEFSKMQILGDDGQLRPAGMITVEHLFSHRAGFSYGFIPGCAVGALYREVDLRDASRSLEAYVKTLAELPLAFEPGTQWRYSVATDVLGRVLEVVLSASLPDILERYITGPLGMVDTKFYVPKTARERLLPMFGQNNLDDVMVFDEQPQRLVAANIDPEYPVGDVNFCRGASGLYSTLADYSRFMAMLESGKSADGTVLLSRKMLALMQANRIPPAQMPLKIGPIEMAGYGWGLIGRVLLDLGKAQFIGSCGENGWAGAGSTYFWLDPEERVSGIVMAQYLGSKIPIGEDMHTAVNQALS